MFHQFTKEWNQFYALFVGPDLLQRNLWKIMLRLFTELRREHFYTKLKILLEILLAEICCGFGFLNEGRSLGVACEQEFYFTTTQPNNVSTKPMMKCHSIRVWLNPYPVCVDVDAHLIDRPSSNNGNNAGERLACLPWNSCSNLWLPRHSGLT